MQIGFRPMIQIKSRCFFKHLPGLVKYENFFRRIHVEQAKWNCKIFFANGEKATEFYYEIFNLAGGYVYHYVSNFPHVFIFLVLDFLANYRCSGKEF